MIFFWITCILLFVIFNALLCCALQTTRNLEAQVACKIQHALQSSKGLCSKSWDEGDQSIGDSKVTFECQTLNTLPNSKLVSQNSESCCCCFDTTSITYMLSQPCLQCMSSAACNKGRKVNKIKNDIDFNCGREEDPADYFWSAAHFKRYSKVFPKSVNIPVMLVFCVLVCTKKYRIK